MFFSSEVFMSKVSTKLMNIKSNWLKHLIKRFNYQLDHFSTRWIPVVITVHDDIDASSRVNLSFSHSLSLSLSLSLSIYIYIYICICVCIYIYNPCKGVHRSTLLISSSLLLQQCSASCSSNLDGFRDGWLVVVQLLFCGILLPGFVQYSS